MNLVKKIFNNPFQKKTSTNEMFNYFIYGNGSISGSYSDLNLAIEGYNKNIIVYRCIKLIVEQAGLIEYKLYKNDKEILKHPILDLLKKPYPNLAKNAFIENVLSYKLIYGNSYIWMIDSLKSENYTDEEPIFLYPLRSDMVQIKEGCNFLPEYYEYHDTKKNLKFNCTTLGNSNLIHLQPKKNHPALQFARQPQRDHHELYHPAWKSILFLILP